jgi:hypothetical protein
VLDHGVYRGLQRPRIAPNLTEQQPALKPSKHRQRQALDIKIRR